MQNSQPIIEYIHFHRVEIYKVDSLFQLNIRLKSKPIILTLHSLPVIKSIYEHSEYLKSLLQIDCLHELKITVPGYGVFNQKYELEQIGNLFKNLAEYSKESYKSVQKITLEMPGWKCF